MNSVRRNGNGFRSADNGRTQRSTSVFGFVGFDSSYTMNRPSRDQSSGHLT